MSSEYNGGGTVDASYNDTYIGSVEHVYRQLLIEQEQYNHDLPFVIKYVNDHIAANQVDMAFTITCLESTSCFVFEMGQKENQLGYTFVYEWENNDEEQLLFLTTGRTY